jgi:hypothetical protein
MSEATPFEGWCVLELMGHRRLAGYLTEQEIAGDGFLRLDIPKDDGTLLERTATQFYRPAAVYCITPTTEETARRVAAGADPAPVKRWELPAPRAVAEDRGEYDDEDVDSYPGPVR